LLGFLRLFCASDYLKFRQEILQLIRKIFKVNANPKNYANLALIIVQDEIFIPLWALLKFIAPVISTA
jgi:hypothetical protein